MYPGRALLLVTSVVLAAGSAVAQSPPTRPWAAGVSQEKRDEALEIFGRGNEAFARELYTEALKLYKRALESWDHPSIRFNMAETLVNLGQTIEAYENISLALKFGADPLGDDIYRRAKTTKRLLEGQIATIKVASKLDGVQVTLDGEPLFTGPGEATRTLRPGPHQVVGKREGFVTRTWDVNAFAGQPSHVEVELATFEAAARFERRWAQWKPWVVVGAGAALAGGGLFLAFQSRSHFEDYRNEVASQCPFGCLPEELPKSTRDLESRAETENVVGISFLIAGGVGIASGVVLILLNQPRRVADEEPTVAITPIAGAGRAGVAVSFDF